MTNRPLDAYSEVVDTKRRWTVEWYTWLTGLAASVDAGSSGPDPVFGASGPSHSSGDVPDPGSAAGKTRYLREDATWAPTFVLPKQLAGLTLANNSTTPATVLNIDVGSACSDDNTTMMVLSAANFTKNCNASWAAGSGGGALDNPPTFASLAASTWYHVYLIERVDLQVTDVLLSTNVTTPLLPLPYTKKRRIGSILTDGSAHIRPFIQIYDQFLWPASLSGTWDFFNVNTIAPPGGLATINVPPGVRVKALLHVAVTISDQYFVQSPDQSETVAWILGGQSDPAPTIAARMEIWTNTAQNVRVTSAVAHANGFFMSTLGWTDPRGK